MSERNVVSAFIETAAKHSEEICFHYKHQDQWKTLSWMEVADLIRQYARGLMAKGVTEGVPVALMATTRMEWTLMDFAIMAAGGICVPVYPNLPQEHIDFILKDSGARIVVVEGDELCARALTSAQGEWSFDLLIQMEGVCTAEKAISLKALIESGATVPPAAIDQQMARIMREMPASYVYTSGTTGVQKGAVLTHGNFIGELDAVIDAVKFQENEVCLVCLPQAHVLGRMVEFYLMIKGCQSAFAESLDKLAENYREVRPHFVVGVPRMLEKAYERIESMVAQQPEKKQRVFAWAKRTGMRVAKLKEKNEPMGLGLRIGYAIAKRLVFNTIRQRMGGRLHTFISGGAPLNSEVATFFSAVGVKVLEGYGLTETFAAITVNKPEDYRFGTVGKPLMGVEIKLDEDGEIVVRGPMVFKGYLNRPDATAEVLEDGWFRTGDIGEMAPGGFLRITDRKKDIIVTAGGKNVAPQRIEGIMSESPYINHVMVCGDRRKFLTALITLNFDEVGKFAQREGIMYAEPHELAEHTAVRALIDKVISEKNKSLARFETIKRFAILPDDFTPETGEITPTMKVRRRHVLRKYHHLVERLYQD